ncbi:MAG TPA: tetratricopeptide repeat protein [Gemmataceae bacterium]|nr:tetratricopeptide repeat protein [Gemmataceae bacterium]
MHRLRPLLGRSIAVVTLLGLLGLGGAFWYRSLRPENLLRQGQQALARGDLDQAERLARRLEAAGHSDHAHLLRCELFFHLRDYTQAVNEFNHMRDQGELLVEASALCGRWFLLELHRPIEAERFLLFVVSKRPDHVDAHRGLATLYYDQRAWVPAVLHLIQWADLEPRDGRAHRFMGLIYKDLDQPTPAIAAYEEALRRELAPPVVEEVKEELAECLVAQSQYERALALLPDAAETAKLASLRAECLWGLGRGSEAEAVLDRALAGQPRAPELLRLRAKIALHTNRPEAAIPLLERALEIDRQDYAGRHLLAQAYQAVGRSADAAEQRRLGEQTKEALLQMTELVKQASEKPWEASVRQRLAQTCQKLDKPDLAAMWLKAAASCPAGQPDKELGSGGQTQIGQVP